MEQKEFKIIGSFGLKGDKGSGAGDMEEGQDTDSLVESEGLMEESDGGDVDGAERE